MTVKKIIGNAPSQVPRNKDLGSMAYQDAGNYYSTAVQPTFRNRIINGDMRIDQRNSGASVTPASGTYTIDRWWHQLSQPSKISVQRSTTAPAGFVNSAAITSLSAYSVGASDYFNILQSIEGFNVADLGWGTSNAQTITISFWVRSSLTGSFGGAVLNNAQSRSYPFTYAISAANTWEQKSVTIAGDTTGTWLTDTGAGLRLSFGLGAGASYSGTVGSWNGSVCLSATGATSLVGTSGATWYITGVQLEKGSVATPFEFRPYGTELALCQRYYQRYTGNTAGTVGDSGFLTGSSYSTTNQFFTMIFPVSMRSAPTFSISGLSDFAVLSNGAGATPSQFGYNGSGGTSGGSSINRVEIQCATPAVGISGGGCWIRMSSTGWAAFSAEL